MNRFTRTLECSMAINRFAKVERMSQDDIYELFYDCYSAYAEVFIERLRNGKQFRRVMSEYRRIPEFGLLKPSQISSIIFTSRNMAHWFAFAFWRAIDAQVAYGKIDRTALQIELTYMDSIPTARYMEEILYEKKTAKKASGNSLLTEGQAGKNERAAREVTV